MFMIYGRSQLPPQFKETNQVILSICDHQGLQQVRWISLLFSHTAAIAKFSQIYAEGMRRHGAADDGDLDRGIAGWSHERVGMRILPDGPGYRVIMVSEGPEYQSCKAEHP
jgi:hypothetical protein